jgi:hypothetical protein
MDSTVTYRGRVPELDGTSWTIPTSVVSAGQAAAYIESLYKQQQAEEAAAAEADKRQRELLAARLEQSRAAAEAEAATPAPTRDELKAELAAELGDLSTNVIQAAAAIAGRGEAEAAARADWESRHEQLVATSEQVVSDAQAQVQAAQAVTQASSEQVQAELADHRLAVRAMETELREIVSTLVGPEGKQGPEGIAGASTVLSLEDPLEVATDSFATRWLGRPLIDGDGVLVIRPNEILVRRWINNGWSEGPAITPKQELIEAKISSLDASTKVYPTVSSAAGGGTGGSGLADPLTVSIIPKGGSVAVADSSRWQAGGYGIFTSGIIHLEFIPNQGIMGGRHHFVTASFVLLAGVPDTFQMTEFSVLGGGLNGSPAIFDVSIDGSIGAATAPGGLGISLPAGTAQATRIFVTITAADPATRDFTIKGNVIWTPEAATATQLPNLPVRKQPAWLLV